MNRAGWIGKRLGIIGAGNMAEALVRGVCAAKLIPAEQIFAFDPLPLRRELFATLGCPTSETPHDAASCDVVLLSVKPQTIREALAAIWTILKPGTLVISIAAGIPSRSLATMLPPEVKLARVMPNTPLLVGLGMSCVSSGPGMTAADTQRVLDLFAAAGDAVEVKEEQLDAVTALSGSGPAYLFRFAEALESGGAAIGLDPRLTRRLTVRTLRGAAEMLARGGDPADLRTRVTSPGGTTAAALGVFEKRNLVGIIAEALEAARKRGEELGREV